MKIRVGDYDVLDSGSIIGNLDQTIDFELDNLKINILRIIFVDDSTDEFKVTAKVSDTNSNVVELNFINYKFEKSYGNINPIPFGNYLGRPLFFNFRVTSIEGIGKTVHYTWLLGKKDVNG